MDDKQPSDAVPSLEAIHQTTTGYFRAMGKRITRFRLSHEMTQDELARLLGLSQQTVFAIELGDRRVRIDLVPVLAKTFEITSDELLGLKPLPMPRTGRISARQLRHVKTLIQLSAADQRFIIRLAESMLSSRP